MTQEKKKEKVLTWLQKHRKVVSIRKIGENIGHKYLSGIVNGDKDGNGYVKTLSDKYVDLLIGEIKKLKF